MSADRAWYEAGLRFTCRQCGRCCRGPQPGYVWVSDEEVARLAASLELGVDEFGRRYLRRVGARLSLTERPNHDCVFWQEGQGCTVYAARPTQCRTFPFWEEYVRSPEAWRSLGWCQGVDGGRLYERAELEEIVRGAGEAS